MTKEENRIACENAKNEIEEIVEKCIKCGMCKSLCPVFRVIREESISPRGKSIVLEEKIYDRIVYECSLCKACEQKCPLDIKLCTAFRKARQVLILNKQETKANKEMIKNIRKYGNPFGIKIGERGKLYCC
jgi:glycolate oxidase iron-sulfur subunit